MRLRLRRYGGFSMVETLIYMAVSTALFVSSMAIIGDHQARTDFQYGIQELSSQLRDVMNDVSVGYYENPGNFQCEESGGTPNIILGTSQPGTNNECIFVGRVVHFHPANPAASIDGDQVYRVYTVVGVRSFNDSGHRRDVESLTEAAPEIITDLSIAREFIIPNGVEIVTAKSTVNASDDKYAFGFITNFAKYADEHVKRAFETNARNVALFPFDLGANQSPPVIINPADYDSEEGVALCFEGRRNYMAIITIGGNNANLGEDIQIERGSC